MLVDARAGVVFTFLNSEISTFDLRTRTFHHTHTFVDVLRRRRRPRALARASLWDSDRRHVSIRCPNLINCFTNWHWSAANSIAYVIGLGYPLDDPEAPNSLVAIDPRDVHRGPNNVTLCKVSIVAKFPGDLGVWMGGSALDDATGTFYAARDATIIAGTRRIRRRQIAEMPPDTDLHAFDVSSGARRRIKMAGGTPVPFPMVSLGGGKLLGCAYDANPFSRA